MGALGLGFELALTLETTLGSIYTRACISYWGIYIYMYIYIYIYIVGVCIVWVDIMMTNDENFLDLCWFSKFFKLGPLR